MVNWNHHTVNIPWYVLLNWFNFRFVSSGSKVSSQTLWFPKWILFFSTFFVDHKGCKIIWNGSSWAYGYFHVGRLTMLMLCAFLHYGSRNERSFVCCLPLLLLVYGSIMEYKCNRRYCVRGFCWLKWPRGNLIKNTKYLSSSVSLVHLLCCVDDRWILAMNMNILN